MRRCFGVASQAFNFRGQPSCSAVAQLVVPTQSSIYDFLALYLNQALLLKTI